MTKQGRIAVAVGAKEAKSGNNIDPIGTRVALVYRIRTEECSKQHVVMCCALPQRVFSAPGGGALSLLDYGPPAKSGTEAQPCVFVAKAD